MVNARSGAAKASDEMRSVQPGVYCYQYLVDGTWMTSPDVPVGPDDDGHLCNKARCYTWPICEILLWLT